MKTIETKGQKFEVGGTYNPTANELVLTINGDPVMRGSFPPYTPTLRLNATYKNEAFAASCYRHYPSVGSCNENYSQCRQGGLGKGGDSATSPLERHGSIVL